MKRLRYFLVIGTLVFFPLIAFAKTDLSIAQTDITFSKSNIIAGDTVTVYARVFNVGDTDATGYVDFLANGVEMADPQPISLRSNSYDDAFIPWTPSAGTYSITAKLISITPANDDTSNNSTTKNNIIVAKAA